MCVWVIKIIFEIDVNNSVDEYNAVSEKTSTLLPEDTSKNRRRTDYKDKQNTYGHAIVTVYPLKQFCSLYIVSNPHIHIQHT